MNAFLQRLAGFFAAIPDTLRPFRLPITVFFLVATIFLSFGIGKFQLDTSFDAWLSDSDPAVAALDDFRSQFGSDDGLFLVYRAKDGNVFSPQSLSAIRSLTDEIDNWQDRSPEELNIDQGVFDSLDHITRVQSLSNIRYQVSSDDTLQSYLLLPEEGIITPSIAAAAQEIAESQRNLKLLMYSENREFGAIVLSTDFGAIPVQDEAAAEDLIGFDADSLDLALDDFDLTVDETAEVRVVQFEDTTPETYTGFMMALKAIYQQPTYADAFEFFPIGTAGMMDFSMQTMIQASMLVGVAIVIIVLLLYTLFHTGSAVVWPVLTVASSCIWLFGGMSWLGIPSTQLIALTVMLVLAVGIADCVHVMSEYLFFKREGLDHEAAVRRAYEKTGVPILLTTITTMAGMLAIAFGGVGQFVTFGLSSAAGVFAAFVFTVLVLPVLLEFWHPQGASMGPKSPGRWRRYLAMVLSPFNVVRAVSRNSGLSWLLGATWLQPLLDRIPSFSYRFRWPIVVIFMGLFAVCAYGTTKVEIDTNLIELFKKGTPVRTAYEVVDENMAGTGSMEIMLDFKASDAFADADVLKAVDQLEDELTSRYADYVVRTASIAKLVKATNQVMNNDDPAYYVIPDSSQTVSQLLFLFNSSNPEDRRAVVSDDYSRSHVTIQLRNAGSNEYSEIFADIDQVIHDSFSAVSDKYPEWQVNLTGSWALMMRMSDVISNSQVRSLTFAILIISALLTLTLGSIQGGLLAIIPNILPSILAFGLMGLLGMPLDAD
ncbi:MAG: MMPL family transporter, partial [Paracoccaceae bacterium]|nr:MMPL family transporter [Paracoccaceae bacterium]